MFLLTQQMTEKKMVSFVVAMLYAFLPFLPVYGLSQYGMPLLLFSILCLYKDINVKRSLLYVILYAGMSSFVLCGFAWVAVWGVLLLILICKRKWGKIKNLLIGFSLLLGIYIVENISLFLQTLGIGSNELSHKSAYVIHEGNFLSSFLNYFKNNVQHCADNHIWIGALVIVVLLIVLLFRKQFGEGVHKQCQYLIGVLGILCILSTIAACWDCSAIVSIRAKIGALGAFQMNRFLWLAPMLWLVVLAYCLDILWSMKGYMKKLIIGGSLIMLSFVAFVTLKNSFVKPNIQTMLNPNYGAMSFADYLAIGVMEQVEEYIIETQGLQKEEYKVASLGIDPAAALYHGFYTVDGYSNNYSLAYKEAFREVIAPELEKNEYIQKYFDDWGNRCYLFSAEYPGYYMIQKDTFTFQNLSLDISVLRELGCKYIFSAAYVANAEENGLILMNEEAFETEESYYKIYVYKIKE
uniref:DUF6044 family protein n=1 Tax=Acetatifactor sp. TaxID=1872090 RepID=UPI004055EF79